MAASTARLAVLQACDSSRVSDGQSDGMESYFRKEAAFKDMPTSLNPHGIKYAAQYE